MVQWQDLGGEIVEGLMGYFRYLQVVGRGGVGKKGSERKGGRGKEGQGSRIDFMDLRKEIKRDSGRGRVQGVRTEDSDGESEE